MAKNTSIRVLVNTAKASQDLSWQDISDKLKKAGIELSANSLAIKNSRESFKATELLAILKVLKVDSIPVQTEG